MPHLSPLSWISLTLLFLFITALLFSKIWWTQSPSFFFTSLQSHWQKLWRSWRS
uniref:ATP synthase F0 subunit 8 n=1 Tax=Phascolosoma sp. f LL-2023 TaxID=3082417 RepID=A0AA97BBB6_9ANNE|nr:ATP synthase F0 subunit 8 [Phascolosoma sp. f LL-2023]